MLHLSIGEVLCFSKITQGYIQQEMCWKKYWRSVSLFYPIHQTLHQLISINYILLKLKFSGWNIHANVTIIMGHRYRFVFLIKSVTEKPMHLYLYGCILRINKFYMPGCWWLFLKFYLILKMIKFFLKTKQNNFLKRF